MYFINVTAMRIVCLMLSVVVADHVRGADFSSKSCDFGEAYQFSEVKCTVELANNGDTPISVISVKGSREGDEPDLKTLTISPKGRAYLPVRVSTQDSIGYTKRYFEVHTDDSADTVRFVEVKGMVMSVLDDVTPSADFGIVQLSSRPLPTLDVKVSSREIPDLQILEVLSKPSYVDVAIGKDRRSLSVAINRTSPWGLHKKIPVKLRINSDRQREVWVAVKSDLRGEVVPDSNPFGLGVMRQGDSKEFLLRLRSTSGKDFKIGDIKVNGFEGSTSTAPCDPLAPGCRVIKLTIDGSQQTGEIGGHLGVSFPEYDKVLDLYVWGMLLGKKTQVLDFTEEMEKQEAAKKQLTSALPPSSTNITDALKDAVASGSPAAPPPGRGPLLKWSVANQSSIYGFMIYRADSEQGPFMRLNEETLLSDGRESSSYQWRDSSAAVGRTYWYMIGYVKKNGAKENLTSAQAVVAK